MKILYVSIGIVFSVQAQAIGFDGCFQLYQVGTMASVICLEGTAEEGIGGSGVRLAVFPNNTDDLIRCAEVKVQMGSNGNLLVFSRDHLEMELSLTAPQVDGLQAGVAKFANSTYLVQELSQTLSQRFQNKMSLQCGHPSKGV